MTKHTQGAVIREIAAHFKQAGIENYLFEAEIIVAHIINCSRTALYSDPDKILTAKEAASCVALQKRRLQGEPLAYLLGRKDFWEHSFYVSHDTLIPRAATELLIEQVLNTYSEDKNLTVLDLGTGTGIIACSLAKARPSWQICAVDKSEAALQVAAVNLKNLAIKNVTLLQSDWFSNISGKFDIIVSNPPYVATSYRSEQALQYEPSVALFAGEDGLDDIRLIVQQAAQYLTANGQLFIEHGFDQKEQVAQLIEAQPGLTYAGTYHDLADHPRLSVAFSL